MKNKLFLFCLIVSCSSLLRAEESSEQAALLLKKALKPCSVSYKGHLNVTHWTGKTVTSEDARVWYRPPNRYRWEFLKPDGRIDRVLMTDGYVERLEINPQGPCLRGRAPHGQPKQLPPEQEWKLLRANYQFAQTGAEPMAGRVAEIVELVPRSQGKPLQRVWIDRQSGIILAVKRFQPGDPMAVASRFVQFQLNPEDLEKAFSSAQREAVAQGRDPEYLSPEDYQAKVGLPVGVPKSLPLGYELESVDVFQSDNHSVVHYRFTDGLSAISVFQSDRPARFSNPQSHPVEARGRARWQANEAGHILQEQSGPNYWTLISDLSPASMQILMSSLK